MKASELNKRIGERADAWMKEESLPTDIDLEGLQVKLAELRDWIEKQPWYRIKHIPGYEEVRKNN